MSESGEDRESRLARSLSRQDVVRLASFALAYFLAHFLAFLFPDSSRVLMAVWPAGGIGLAALLLSRRGLWPALLLVFFMTGNAANVISGRPLLSSLGYVTGNVLESLACASLITAMCGANVRFTRIKEILALIVSATLVNACTAFVGAGAAALTGSESFWHFWITWWIAHGLGLMVVVPFLVSWSDIQDQFSGLRAGLAAEWVLFIAIWCASGWLIFTPDVFPWPFKLHPYVLVALLAWPALRFAQRGATLALFLLAATTVTSGAVRTGPLLWGGSASDERLLAVQLFLGFTSITGLLLAASYTERKLIEEALRRSEESYADLYNDAPDIFLSVDIETKTIVQCNRTMERLTGYTLGEIIGRPVTDLVSAEYLDAERRLHEAMSLHGEAYGQEVKLKRKHGTPLHISISATAIRDEQGRPVRSRAVWHDITERKTMELALKQSEQSYRQLFELESHVLLVVETESGGIIDVNAAAIRLYGYSREEWLSMQYTETLADSSGALPAQENTVTHEALRWHRKKNAEVFPVDVLVSHFRRGEVLISLFAIRDITEQRRREEENAKLEEMLRQSQKLESIGTLSGGVAHEFNNLLTVVNGYSAFLINALEVGHPLRKYAEAILKAGEHGASLTAQLLAFSRKQMIQPRTLNLNVVLEDSAQFLRHLMGEDVELVIVLDPALGQVLADATQIRHILMNLATNARDAMPGGGRLTIETANFELHENSVSLPPDATPGWWVRLTATDNGIGMDEQTRKRIFEPFFTTKETGKGPGLGLAMVYGIVRQNRGWIEVKSDVGRGSTFAIYLSRQDVPAAGAKPAAAGNTSVLKASQTVLLVEDQESVRSFASAVLTGRGYRVLSASDGAEAVRLTEQHSGKIHLMITDAIMPGMDGRELARRLAITRPEMKLLFISGYAEELITDRGIVGYFTAFLPKPFSPDQLLEKVQEVLAPEPSEHC
jgi:PAS domain S-box-containing protein